MTACVPCTDPRSLSFPVDDRKSTRLNSSHLVISYAVFCLKKQKASRPTEDAGGGREDAGGGGQPWSTGLCPSRSTNFFFFNDTATTEIYTLALRDTLPD